MRACIGLLLLVAFLAGSQAQVAGRDTGETVRPVSTAMEAGSETFVAGSTTGVCACGAGAATPECKAAVEVQGCQEHFRSAGLWVKEALNSPNSSTWMLQFGKARCIDLCIFVPPDPLGLLSTAVLA
jgi:hypothetical protein